MNHKISLSYSTLNALINAPHTYINKMSGLTTFETSAMTDGKNAHDITQLHVSGKKLHPMLTEKGLPTFELVEEKKWDERMRVRFDIDDKYYLTGFLDGASPKRLELAEFKFGKVWSAGEFARLVQWKIYAIGWDKYKKIWFVNAPKDIKLWNADTIKVYNQTITEADKKDGWDFLHKGIHVIENIREEVGKEMALKKEKGWTGRSRWCYYNNCPFCV